MSKLTPEKFSQVTTLYKQLLTQSINTISTVNCSISMNLIDINMNDNCSLVISNICSNTVNALTLLDYTISEITSIEQNTINTNLLTIYNGSKAACLAEAALYQNITVQDLHIDCKSTIPISFEFVNTGSAAANCLIQVLLKNTITQTSSNDQESTSSNITFNTIFPYVGIILLFVSCVVASCEYLLQYKNRKEVIFKTRNYEVEAL